MRLFKAALHTKAVLNKVRYALCPMPYARLSSVHIRLLRKAIFTNFVAFNIEYFS
jgi:hypothetical protein